jgi:hypothetical protein
MGPNYAPLLSNFFYTPMSLSLYKVHYQWDDDEVRFVLNQHAELDFYSASSLKQQSAGRNVTPFGHIISIPSQPIFAHSFPRRG